jgi:hypothetical protein
MDLEKTFPVYTVKKGNDVLAATLNEDGCVIILYKNIFGKQYVFYKDGVEQYRQLETSSKIFTEGNLFYSDEAYSKWGPELRAKLPERWKKNLGNYLISGQIEEDIFQRGFILAHPTRKQKKLISKFFSKQNVKAREQIDWTNDITLPKK